jgi:hypothetical protein
MELRRIYSLAKSIQPFIKGGGEITTDGVYNIIMTNNHLSFIHDLISSNNIPVLVFTTYEIAIGNDDPKIVGKVKNNLFGFNTYEFGDTENEIDCEECSGGGEITCSDCDGNGTIECSNCGGTGEEDCPDCDGTGEDEEGDTCNNCEGSGKVTCSDCDGDGSTDCQECSHGNVTCWECNGRGSETIFDRLPYELAIYVSYDLLLKDEIESFITQNKDVEEKKFGDKTLLLFMRDYFASDSETENVDLKFANKTYFGKVIEIEDNLIKPIRRNTKLMIDDLDYLEDRFES